MAARPAKTLFFILGPLLGPIFSNTAAKVNPATRDDHHGITFRSFTNLPVRSCGASVASQTIVAAPSATERVAFSPPMSVRTQPGQTLFTANFGSAAAS